MRKLVSSIRLSVRGIAMPDLLVSTAITATIAAGMLTAIVSMQKSTAASHHHVRSQLQQARLIDYIARDLRRALTVNVDSVNGSERLNLTIPDYYSSTGAPNDPTISKGGILYGNGTGIPVSYFKADGQVFRSVNGTRESLATDVDQFAFDFTDDGEQAIGVSISFAPRFQFSSANAAALRDGTTVYATTLLRNKRTP